MTWFDLTGDARLGRCATENCGGQAVFRLEAGGVGSNYCSGCHSMIVEIGTMGKLKGEIRKMSNNEITQFIERCEELWLEPGGPYTADEVRARHDGMMVDLATAIGALKSYQAVVALARAFLKEHERLKAAENLSRLGQECGHDWVVDGHYAYCAREGCDYVRKPQGNERKAESTDG